MVLILLAMISGCARMMPSSPPAARTETPKPMPQAKTALGVPTQTPPSGPPAPRAVVPTKPAPPPSPPAVLALMEEAETAASAGQWDTSAATLERAIRIQPRNPALWHRLAKVRLEQGQFQSAEDLAKKSNVFASGDQDLVKQNWLLIAQARRQKGDADGAKDAEAKAGR